MKVAASDTSITEAIVLAGGKGTRLRETIGTIPKCLAPIAGKPFLHYLLAYLQQSGILRVVFALGTGSDAIIEWLAGENLSVEIKWVVEPEPLGTGGGILLAMQHCAAADVVVVNGDTLFTANLAALLGFHQKKKAETTLSLKAVNDASRFGCVVVDDHDRIIDFLEKSQGSSGLINGGIYVINRQALLRRNFPERFSFETDYLQPLVHEADFYGMVSDAYFIDIGVPEDFAKAQIDFKTLFAA